MGGSIGDGNTTVSAEFNIYADPEAAAIVFESGLPITMMGLDVTHQAVLLTAGAGAASRALGHGVGRGRRGAGRLRARPRGPVVRHAADVGPRRGRGRAPRDRRTSSTVAEYDVQVDTGNGPARGRTVCDGLPVRIARKGRAPNAQVGIRIDRDRFEDILVDAYGRLP